MKKRSDLETRVSEAIAGDALALEAVVRAVTDDIYGLAIRMLWHPADAQDATQEILIRICTSLSSFEGRSSFRTWVYRVAVRALLNIKRGGAEPPSLSFEDFGTDLLDGLQAPQSVDSPEHRTLEREVKIGCTHAMLLCLDREHRLAYLLGDIVGLEGSEAAAALEVDPPTYRKRLSRARKRVQDFVEDSCGLVNREAECRCASRVAPAIAKKRVDPEALLFAEHPVVEATRADADAVVDGIAEICDSRSLMRSNPKYQAPEGVLDAALEFQRLARSVPSSASTSAS